MHLTLMLILLMEIMVHFTLTIPTSLVHHLSLMRHKLEHYLILRLRLRLQQSLIIFLILMILMLVSSLSLSMLRPTIIAIKVKAAQVAIQLMVMKLHSLFYNLDKHITLTSQMDQTMVTHFSSIMMLLRTHNILLALQSMVQLVMLELMSFSK
jgi:hypothetical protein